MSNKTFWNRCVELNCAVLPVKVYAKYNESGNLSKEDFIGIKYTAVPFYNEVVCPDFWCMINTEQTDAENYFDTPEEALDSLIPN